VLILGMFMAILDVTIVNARRESLRRPGELDYPIYPGTDADPQNPQKVDQYIPVRILFTGAGVARVAPGQSVTVHIHKR
jgi:hypothetical protein